MLCRVWLTWESQAVHALLVGTLKSMSTPSNTKYKGDQRKTTTSGYQPTAVQELVMLENKTHTLQHQYTTLSRYSTTQHIPAVHALHICLLKHILYNGSTIMQDLKQQVQRSSCDGKTTCTGIEPLPTNLVMVIPLSTEAPMSCRAVCMRCGLLPDATRKACTMCAQNSTAMPRAMVRFTSDTAFNWIPRRYITPSRSIRIMATTSRMMLLAHRLAVKAQQTANTPSKAPPSSHTLFCTTYKYCSKKMWKRE